ncbi:SDR family NAD(P)-dependent oxidoreductase [Phytoactinopolyspora halophila]|nr:SDR family oxidoreductase [Phytoactinopolyspora halophila]
MDLGMTGRTVIVTGAPGGIGRHIARTFAAEGANVVVTYRQAHDDAERLAKEFDGRGLAVPYNMADDDAAGRLVERVLEWAGRIDVLVNNAVYWGADAPTPGRAFESVPDERWLGVVRTNIEGALRLSRAVAPVMREQKWGRMVHISSSIATDGMAGAEYYGTAKAALHGFSRSAAFNLGSDGDILSNVVMPGLTRTETNEHIITEEIEQHITSVTPLGRLLNASEIAGPVAFLGSAANTGITGQAITVTGGA